MIDEKAATGEATGIEVESSSRRDPLKTKALVISGNRESWEKQLDTMTDATQLEMFASDIARAWTLLDENEAFAVATKLATAGSVVHEGTFPVTLCLQLIKEKNPSAACRILSETCFHALKDNRKGVGFAKNLQPIRTLLSTQLDELAGLPLENLKAAKRKKTVDAILQAAFITTAKQGNARLSPQLQARTVEVLAKKFGSLDVYEEDSDVPTLIMDVLANWPVSNLADLTNILGKMPRQVREALSHLACVEANDAGTSAKKGKEKPTEIEKEPEPGPKSFKEALSLVEEYFNQAKKDLLAAEKNLENSHREVRELSALKEMCEAKSRKIEALQDKNNELLEKSKGLEETLKACRTDLHLAQKDNKNLRKQLERERESHEGVTHMLGRKVDAEADSQLRVFKERLSKDLAIEYADAQRIASSPMTIERGEMLSHSFQEVFEKLERLGVQFRGR